MNKFLLLLLLPFSVFAQNFSPAEIALYQQQAKRVTIIRDNWGIPHVMGQKDADAGIAAMLLVESFKYPIAHPLHVATVCELVTKRLNWSDEEKVSNWF